MLLLAGVAACSSDDDAAVVSCADVMAQTSYEAMRQLAAAGLAADPAALRAALPGEPRAGDGDTVELPGYPALLEQFDDAQRATLLSALSSSMTGVGGVFDLDAFTAATSQSGDCAGWASDG